jgi:hypothetical protein
LFYHFLIFIYCLPLFFNLVLISTSLSELDELESDDEGTDESDEPADSASDTTDNGVYSIAAYKALISDCNSSIAP